jgi:hypothetical protein
MRMKSDRRPPPVRRASHQVFLGGGKPDICDNYDRPTCSYVSSDPTAVGMTGVATGAAFMQSGDAA